MDDMPTMLRIRVQQGPLGALLDARTRDDLSASLVAKRDLERYYTVLANSVREVQAALGGEKGACLVCDALNGVWLTEASAVGLAWAEVADHIRLNGAAEKWGLTEDEAADLVERLRDLSPGATATLVDAVERWWHDAPAGDDREEWLRRAGLIT